MNVLDDAWREGQQAWPTIALGREQFEANVQDREGARRFPADVYIAAACLAGIAGAVEAFEREVLPAARGAVEAIDDSPAFVEEVMQRVRLHVLVGDHGEPRLVQYAGRGPLRAWVGIAAARAALTARRGASRRREVRAPDGDWAQILSAISTSDPELELIKRQYASAFSQALRDAVAALPARSRAVLRMSFGEGLSIDEIGTVYAVHRSTAARWIQGACAEIQARARQLLGERLALSPQELERMTALVRSQLDVTISQLLPRTS